MPLGDPQLATRGAITLALLGSPDTLLISLGADSVTRTHHDSDRTLIGQGIGNTAAALPGCLPHAPGFQGSPIPWRSSADRRPAQLRSRQGPHPEVNASSAFEALRLGSHQQGRTAAIVVSADPPQPPRLVPTP